MQGEVPDRHAMIPVGQAMNSLIDIPEEQMNTLHIPVAGIVGELDSERQYVERMGKVLSDFQLTVLPGLDHDATYMDKTYVTTYLDFLVRF